MLRVLQVNLDDTGGAFSLVFQVQKKLENKIIFDYYSMASFSRNEIRREIERLNGTIKEAKLRKNRLFGHFLLPLDFYRFLKNNSYKVIHIHSDTAWKLLLYALPAKKAGIQRIIVHSHSSDVNGDYRWLKFICHIIGRFILPHYTTDFLTCSDKATTWMYPKKYHNKVIRINNGVDVDHFIFDEELRKETRKQLGIKEGDILLGTVGNFSYQKNPIFFLNVLKKIRIKSDKFKIIFIGDGDNKIKVEKYAQKIGVYKNSIFYGKTSNIKEMLSAMDVFVMTSRFEGLPVSAVEAQANGLTCFLSNKIAEDTKIIDCCKFIEAHDLMAWSESILLFSSNLYKIDNEELKSCVKSCYETRTRAGDIVKKRGFDISHTAVQLLALYEDNK